MMSNREIKFRGWSVPFNRWTYGVPTYIAATTKGNILPNTYLSCFVEGGTCEMVKKESLNQFTGLKDREGKDIYEGDIVSVPWIDPMGGLHVEDENYKAEVFFKNGSFCIRTYSGAQHEEISVWCKVGKIEYVPNVGDVAERLPETYLKVIGNTYQTELIS